MPVQHGTVDWLGRQGGTLTTYVSAKYVPKFQRYARRRARYLGLFHACLASLIVAMLVAVLASAATLIGIDLLFLGVLIWMFPFATQATVDLHGAATSIRIARLGSIILALLGAALVLNAPSVGR